MAQEYASSVPGPIRKYLKIEAGGGVNIETLSADKVLTVADAHFQALDGTQNVDLPAEDAGLWWLISNTGAGTLTIRDDAGATVTTLTASQAAWVICSNTAWSVVRFATV